MTTSPLRWRSQFPLAFGSMFRDLERWVRDYDEAFVPTSAIPVPALHAEQDDDEYHVTADLPGFDEKSVKVNVHRGVLTVSGERNLSLPAGFHATHRERGSLRFSRSLRLPDEVQEGDVKATMKDGILSLRLPKRPEVKPRQIPVALG